MMYDSGAWRAKAREVGGELRRFDVESDIQGGGGVGEGADGDAVYARLGDRSDGLQGDAARGFQLDAGLCGRLVAHGDGHFHSGAVHVVEEDDVDGFDLEDLLELLEVIDLDLDEAGGVFGAALVDDGLEEGGELADGDGGEVVVLDQ